jgi:hypothetical protein
MIHIFILSSGILKLYFFEAAYDCKNLTNRDKDINSVVESISGLIEVGSPKNLALQWLLNNDTSTNACDGLNSIQQRYSLAVFYYSTLGSDWINNTFWLGPQDECTWYGVACTSGSVTSLFMGTFCDIFLCFLSIYIYRYKLNRLLSISSMTTLL